MTPLSWPDAPVGHRGVVVADCGGDPARLDRYDRSTGCPRRAPMREERWWSRYRPLTAVARQLGFAAVSYGTPTGPSERNVTKRARRAFTPAVPLGSAQRTRTITFPHLTACCRVCRSVPCLLAPRFRRASIILPLLFLCRAERTRISQEPSRFFR